MPHTCKLPELDPRAQSLFVCDSCGAIWEAALENGIFDFDIQDAVVQARWMLVEPAAPARLLAAG